MSRHELRRKSLSAGAVASAALASMCCIAPVGLGALGLSGAALSAFFEPLRPYLLSLAAGLLGLGFYFTLSARSVPGEVCGAEAGRLLRLARPFLWGTTVAVIGLASFPSLATWAERGDSHLSDSGVVPFEVVVLRVEGMTCETCAPEVRRHLLSVPGVLDAAVRYEAQLAEVRVRAEQGPEMSALVEAIRQSGYTARVGASP